MPVKKKVVPPLVRKLRERLGHSEDLYMVCVLDRLGPDRIREKYGRKAYEFASGNDPKHIWLGADAANSCAKYCIQGYGANEVGLFKMVKIVARSTPPIVAEEMP